MKIKGSLVKYSYRDNKTGMSKAIIKTFDDIEGKNKYNEITIRGIFPSAKRCYPFEIDVNSDLSAKDVNTSFDKDLVIKFLSTFDNLTERKIRNIYEKKGADVFSDYEKLKNVLTDASTYVIGITAANALFEPYEVNANFKYLSKHKGTYEQAMRLSRLYPKDGVSILKKNPYVLALKLDLDMATCDRIAYDSENLARLQDARLKEAKRMLMLKVRQTGDSYVTLSKATKMLKSVLNNECYNMPISEGLTQLILKGTLKRDDRYYVSSIDSAENKIITEFYRLNVGTATSYKPEYCDIIAKKNGVSYGDQQKQAFNLLGETGVVVVTGGPGTGKTTTIKGLIEAFCMMREGDAIIKLCAPTGRAAQRMSESTGMEAVTIHRLIELKPYGNDIICKDKSNPIEADLIVCDEFSMADTELVALLFNAIKTGTMVIIVGDVNQLASVGPGSVLRDLLACDCIRSCMLTDVYRQASGSEIITNAIKINKGDWNLTSGDDFYIYEEELEEAVLEKIKKLIVKYHNPDDAFYAQVLAPTRKGFSGTNAINAELQEMLNPDCGNDEFIYGKTHYRVGDKILMKKNNYVENYCNGDIGVITNIIDDGIEVDLNGIKYEITGANCADLSLSYGMTIHKSQGSEFPVSIIAITNNSPNMLVRNLLYTGVTRAKKLAIVVYEKGSLKKSVENISEKNTELGEKLSDKYENWCELIA